MIEVTRVNTMGEVMSVMNMAAEGHYRAIAAITAHRRVRQAWAFNGEYTDVFDGKGCIRSAMEFARMGA